MATPQNQVKAYLKALGSPVNDMNAIKPSAYINGVLGGSPSYQMTRSQLGQQQNQYQANTQLEKSQANQNYQNAATQLGYRGGTLGSDGSMTGGSWDTTNMATAAGQAYNQMNNDFAGRGLGMSSGYARDLGNTQAQLNNQLGQLGTQNQQTNATLSQNQAAYQAQQAQALQQAQLGALQTYVNNGYQWGGF